MWGDGKQTRSFTYIDDCVEGILRITKSDFKEPLNLGSSEMVSMNNMMETICQFDGGKLPIRCAGIRSVCVLPVHCADRSVRVTLIVLNLKVMTYTLHICLKHHICLCRHIPGPEGVRGRNSDNALILKQLGWEPTVKLADGLKMTYDWIKEQLTSEQDHSAYSKSTIVQTSAPRELGSLREADGKEGFEKAKQAAREGFEAAGVTVNGQSNVRVAS